MCVGKQWHGLSAWTLAAHGVLDWILGFGLVQPGFWGHLGSEPGIEAVCVSPCNCAFQINKYVLKKKKSSHLLFTPPVPKMDRAGLRPNRDLEQPKSPMWVAGLSYWSWKWGFPGGAFFFFLNAEVRGLLHLFSGWSFTRLEPGTS